MMCAFDGCVAAAVVDDKCFVHSQDVGTKCELCKGKGRRWYDGQKTTMTCLNCGGTGLKDRSVGRKRHPVTPVDKRDLIQLAGEPEPTQDALTVAEREKE
jgi:DnaJ-class molecular chaperone